MKETAWYAIKNSRGHSVAEETLDEDYQGVRWLIPTVDEAALRLGIKGGNLRGQDGPLTLQRTLRKRS